MVQDPEAENRHALQTTPQLSNSNSIYTTFRQFQFFLKRVQVLNGPRLMETTEGSKGVSDIDVSKDGQRQPIANAYHSGVTLIPRPSDDPRDPLVGSP